MQKVILYSTQLHPPAHKYSDIYCNFACDVTITYFEMTYVSLPHCCLTRFTTLLNYYLID